MENRYKVELWIKEIEELVNSSKELNFNASDNNSLKIVSNQMEDIFSYLSMNYPAKIVNLDLKDKTINKAIGEYLYSTSEEKRSLIFSSSDKEEQREILFSLIKENDENYKNYSTNSLYISFGVLDYYDSKNRKEVKSAPLVFMPIKVTYDENKKQFSIRQINKELYLNLALINFLRKTKKIDISYPINSRFSILEYLSFVANKVHLLRWSVNNATFISTFDLSIHKTLEDLILKQEKIATLPLVKSVSYFNSEFFNFNNLDLTPLNKKLLTILSIDNDETTILQKIVNRESLFIRTDNEYNKFHLLNATLSSFLLNNKKVLITYSDSDSKEKFLANLDESLKPYFLDLNKESLNKNMLIDRLNDFEIDRLTIDTLDSYTSQDVLNNYYETKNGFKKIINALRKKHEPFSFSINELIERYYSLTNNMVSVEIPHINEITKESLEDYIYDIRDFSNTIKKLGCFYKDHPFYGFNKSTMMQEEYGPLKKAILNLSLDIKHLKTILESLSNTYSLPKINNLKQLKAILNIFNNLELFAQYDSSFFVKEVWNDVYEKLSEIKNINTKIEDTRKIISDKYGNNVFTINDTYLDRCSSGKKLSKKEIKELRNHFNTDLEISLSLLKDYFNDLEKLSELDEEKYNIYNLLPECFKNYIINDELILDDLNKLEEATHSIRVALNYFHQNNIAFDFHTLIKIKEKNQIEEILQFKLNIQSIFNKTLDNTNLIQEYFNEEIYDFSTLDFDEYINKTDNISKNFISINDYLDFLVSLWKTNKTIKGLGNSLLEEKDYTLFEKMFYKRFYHDYALHLTNINLGKNITDKMIFDTISKHNHLDENRMKLFNSIIRNNYIETLKKQTIALKRYEKGYLDEEKNNASFIPLSKLTSMAHESIYYKIPLILTPSKDVSSLLSSEQYYFDVVIVLSNRNMKTKDLLTPLYRSNQVLVFDNVYINKDYELNYIDTIESERFVPACKKAYTNVNYISKTYTTVPLSSNSRNVYLKNYLYKYLIKEGFEVAKDVNLKDRSVDFIVRMPSRKGLTAIIINRLPYYSIESAKESIKQNDEFLSKYNYYSINVFPFIFFKNEEEELKNIKQTIINNSFNTPQRRTKVVKKKISDILFEKYISPREYYLSINNKNSYSRRELFINVLNKCAPVLRSEMLSIFPTDGELFISLLLKNNEIYLKEGFIYLTNKEIEFKSYQHRENEHRKLDSITNEELIDGIVRIVTYTNEINDSTLIPLVLSCLGYKTMNASLYKRIEHLLIEQVKIGRLILEEGLVFLNQNYINKEEANKEIDDIKLIIRDE